MFNSILVWAADQGRKLLKGKKDFPGHTDDKIGLDAVRLLGITERSGAFS